MANTPDIRFEGFSEEWEQRKLGDVAERITRKNQDLVSTLPLTISAQYGLIDQNEFFEKRVASKDVSGYYLINKGEFAYNKSTSSDAPWGAIKRLERYENGVLSTLYIVFGIKDQSEIDSGYLVAYYDTELWYSGVRAIAAEGARNHGLLNITPADFFRSKLVVPQDIEEQKQIGKYFNTLNNLITHHQRKCDEMSELKKYMLQKMFPKKGEKFPEIRFSGFTEPWKQRKVTELGKIFIGLVTTMTEHYTNEGTLLIRNSDIKDGRFEFGENPIYLEESFAKANSLRMHQVGDVITVHTGDVGTSAVINEDEVNSMGFATIVTRPYTKVIDSDYLCAFLNTDRHKKWAVGVSTGDGRTNYNLGDYYECVVPVPSLEEQKKIGEYVKNLNNLITHHQRKHDELKELKKYMLQNMFPKKG